MGSKRTLARITERFMWPGISKDVYHFVSDLDDVYTFFVSVIVFIFTWQVETWRYLPKNGQEG